MRRIVLLGLAAAAVLLIIAAIVGLRGIAPSDVPLADRAAPPVPIPAKPPTPNSAKAPSFDVVTVTPQGQAVIAGRAAPGDRVRVLDGGKSLGEVTADARGEWVLVPSAPIPPGDRQMSLEATGKDGGPARRSGDVVALSVKPPTAEPNLAVLVPEDADKPAQMLQQPKEGRGLSLDTARHGTGNRLVLSGHADPGARLNIYAGNQLLGTATADAKGKWTLVAPPRQLAENFEFRLDQLAADGSVARRIGVPFESPPAPTLAAGTAGESYIVRRGNSLWVIAQQIYGEGVRYTAIYSANREQIQNPDKIFPGQHFRLPKS